MSIDFLTELLSILKIQTREFDEPPPLQTRVPPIPPTIAMIYEVDILPNGQGYDFKFTKYDYNVDVSGQKLQQTIQDLYTPSYSWDGANPVPAWPFSSYLSVKNMQYVYIIYLLKAGRNWQFSHKKAPITVSKDAKAKGAYFEATKADSNGMPTNLGTTKDGCRVAYLIADAEAAFAENREYVDRINLHVDMKYSGPNQEVLFMPLIVDPDIRYPGGSGP